MSGPDRRAARSDATRAALVAAARELFVARGYADVSTGDIADAAGVTRNAVYYHFPDKRAIFLAVYRDVEDDVAGRVIPAALAETTFTRQVEVACDAFLTACLDPAVARVSVLDAPGVLGFEQMREVDNANYLGAFREVLSAAIDDGQVRPLPVDTLASMLLGALDEAALLIASADDPDRARGEAAEVARSLVRGLLTTP